MEKASGPAETEKESCAALPAEDADARDRAAVLASLAPVTVIVGHYGVGKTNLALNLALDAAAAGYEAVLADLDVVNPYFRSAEYRAVLEAAGARLVAPVFSEAGTSLDVPSLTGGVRAAIEEAYARAAEEAPAGRQAQRGQAKGASRPWLEATTRRAEPGARPEPDGPDEPSSPEAQRGQAKGASSQSLEATARRAEPAGRPGPSGPDEPALRPLRVIIDVGGDDAGATALGRFAGAIAAGPHELWYVVNPYRSLTPGAAEALEVLREVEAKARLHATAVVANPHLKADTDAAIVARGLPAALDAAGEAGLPLVFATAPKRLARQERDELRARVPGSLVYPVDVVVRTPWETER